MNIFFNEVAALPETVGVCGASEDLYCSLADGDIIEMENVHLFPSISDALVILDSEPPSSASSGISNPSFSTSDRTVTTIELKSRSQNSR